MSNAVTQSRAVPPGEQRLMAAHELAKNPTDNLSRIEFLRDMAAADREEAFLAGDNVKANEKDAYLKHLVGAARELRSLRARLEVMDQVLNNRLVIALKEAKVPPWVATHRHYKKGDLYRVTGIRWNAEHDDLVEEVEYDDSDGKKFTISRRRWESVTDSGKLRYAPIMPGEIDAS